VWLFTIEVPGWRPSGGACIAAIGSLSVSAEVHDVSAYMEAIFTPGMTAPVHHHAGPEAWDTVAGATCVETPDGKLVGRAGGAPVMGPGRPPMPLTATGTETRRALVLILHDASQHATMLASDWTPQGLCQEPALSSL
jgi:hypothetical protein